MYKKICRKKRNCNLLSEKVKHKYHMTAEDQQKLKHFIASISQLTPIVKKIEVDNREYFICMVTGINLEDAYLIDRKHGSFHDPIVAVTYLNTLKNENLIDLNLHENLIKKIKKDLNMEENKMPLQIDSLLGYKYEKHYNINELKRYQNLISEHIHNIENKQIPNLNYETVNINTYLKKTLTDSNKRKAESEEEQQQQQQKKKRKKENNVNIITISHTDELLFNENVALGENKKKIGMFGGQDIYATLCLQKPNNLMIILSNGDKNSQINSQVLNFSENCDDPHTGDVIIISNV